MSSHSSKPIAIVGIACRLPGGIVCKDDLWRLLLDGGHVGGEAAADVAAFDADFFRVSAREADLMDPQHRLLLELSWECLEDAAHAPAELTGSRTGVFVGASGSDYRVLLAAARQAADPHAAFGTTMALLANRISYFYDWRGPSLQIDTACSSSLVAFHQAVRALQNGDCEQALVGGVNMTFDSANAIAYRSAGMLSSTGRCKPFAAAADGIVRSEGAIMAMLKPLDAAIHDRDHVYAVVKGSAINHGGRAWGLTVPNMSGQAQLIEAAYHDARIPPDSVTYHEAHGTGTVLGDPIEVAALKAAFARLSPQNGHSRAPHCALGSVKGNLGHLEAAAGLAGLLKVVLALRARMLPGNIGIDELNPRLGLANSPFFVLRENVAWETVADTPLRASISSFGAGGANAHVVLEEYVEERAVGAAPQVPPGQPQIIVLSARTEVALSRQVQRLLAALQRDFPGDLCLGDIAHTLQVGREALNVRLALIATSTDSLKSQCEAFLRGERSVEGMHTGTVSNARPLAELFENDDDVSSLVDLWMRRGKLAKVLQLWVAGVALSWSQLSGGAQPRRVSLPTYPFERIRHWACDEAAAPAATLLKLRPVWELKNPGEPGYPDRAERVALLGGSENHLARLRELHPEARPLLLPNEDSSIEEWVMCLERHGPCDHLVWLVPPQASCTTRDATPSDGSVGAIVVCFRLIKALLQRGYATRSFELTVVTKAAQAVHLAGCLDPAHAGVHALAGTFAKENTAWSIRLVDLETYDEPPFAEILCLPTDSRAHPWVRRNGSWYQHQLVPVQLTVPEALSPWRQQGVYVIIGGAGKVGYCLTEYLLRNYQAQVIWIGRRPLDPVIERRLLQLTQLGGSPEYFSADAADSMALGQVYQKIKARHGRIHGLVHAALASQVCQVAQMQESDLQRALASKAATTASMARVFADEPLEFVLFMSSLITFIRSAGWGHYAAGCAFQETYAVQLSRRWQCPVKIANSGCWLDTDFSAEQLRQLEEVGIGRMAPADAVRQLEELLVAPVSQLGFMSVHESAIVEGVNSEDILCIDADGAIRRRRGAALGDIGARGSEVAAQAAGVSLGDMALVRNSIVEQLSICLKRERARVDSDAAFADYGIDSIMGVRMVRALNQSLGIRLSPTCIFDFRSVNELAAHIVSSQRQVRAASISHVTAPVGTGLAGSSGPVADPGRTQRPTMSKEAIAIIGMSGRFPGSANLAELWEHLAAGDDLIEEVTRWELPDKTEEGSRPLCRHGGFLSRIDTFDPLFFNISGTEARYMDPQQRVVLEESWRALEDAGYAGSGLSGCRCGIYVGCSDEDYSKLLDDDAPGQALWGNAVALLPARIAYHLNLQGPAITIDTACSSSLVAIHLACQGLWSGETELALAGGVWIQCTPDTLKLASRAGMLSASGRCRTFDRRADGFVPAEGVGIVVLKRLSDAVRDGDNIHGVIQGSAINQDGASNGITAPSARSQELLEREVYDTFGIDPDGLQMVEAHGTGTILGDPIECQALTRAFRRSTARSGYCALGSIKTNLGHTGAAAGVASVIKVLLSLRHRQIPALLHFASGNPEIDFSDTPFYVNTQLRDWEVEPGARRRAAVSSFGMSGTNAHLVIEEAPPQATTPAGQPGYLVTLSARSEAQLRCQVEQLVAHCGRNPHLDAGDVSFTLWTGRRHHQFRLACIARDLAQLTERLQEFLRSGAAEGVWVASSSGASLEGHREAGAAADHPATLSDFARLYVIGFESRLSPIFSQHRYRRVSLPTYPFAQERYWVTDDVSGRYAAAKVHATPGGMGSRADLQDAIEYITTVLAEALEIPMERLGADRNIGEYGVDSIISTKLRHAIELHFAVKLTGRELFETNTVERLASLVMARAKPTRTAVSDGDSLDDALERFKQGDLDLEAVERFLDERVAV